MEHEIFKSPDELKMHDKLIFTQDCLKYLNNLNKSIISVANRIQDDIADNMKHCDSDIRKQLYGHIAQCVHQQITKSENMFQRFKDPNRERALDKFLKIFQKPLDAIKFLVKKMTMSYEAVSYTHLTLPTIYSV